MLMMDSTNGKVVSQVPIGAGVDATWFDSGTGSAIPSCGDGTTTVGHEDSPDKLTVIQTLKTARGARTMALDPTTHRIYLAAAKYQEPAAGAPANARPQMIPGSMYRIRLFRWRNRHKAGQDVRKKHRDETHHGHQKHAVLDREP